MSAKRFTVVDTRTNRTKTFESNANTVGELKADFRANGIDPEGMAIQEGLTRTELSDEDGAYLPHDVPYRGGITNDLVFRLTQKEKRIKSGAMSRSEVYAQIKALGIADTIAKKYGKNFTMCKTSDLIAEVEAASEKPAEPAKKAPAKSKKAEVHTSECAVTEVVTKIVGVLVNNGIIPENEGLDMVKSLGTELAPAAGYSVSEIDEMFADMDM